MSDRPDPAPPSVHGLSVEALVATGTFHRVWRARAEDGSLRALKETTARGRWRGAVGLHRQARAARQADDPGVLTPVRLAGIRRPVLVLPWMAGGSLADLVADRGPIGLERACAIGEQVAVALAALHRARRHHGDLHLGHVLLDGDGTAVLTGLRRAGRVRQPTDEDLAALCRVVRQVAVGPSGAVPADLAGALDEATSLSMLGARLRTMVPAPDPPPARATPATQGPRARRAATPAPSAPAPRLGPRRRRVAVAAAAVVTVTALGVAAGHVRPGAGSCGAVGGLAADVDGDGCAEPLRWSVRRAVLEVVGDAGHGWRLGRPGDRLLLGDWDCDGTTTPGLHRPSTGEVFTFDRWPDRGAARATADDGEPPACL